MTLIICPNCKKNTPIGNYCVMCGDSFEEYAVCDKCKKYYSKYVSQCPLCTEQRTFANRDSFQGEEYNFVSKLKPFRVSLYILFILSTYFITQMIVVSIIVLVIPSNSQVNTSLINFLSLLTIMISNLIFIFFLIRYNPFNLKKINSTNSRLFPGIQTSLLVILLISLSEILLHFLDGFLDFLKIPSIVVSPYDNYFVDPSTTALFTILIVFIGPLFEELIFRHHFISFLNSSNDSQVSVLVMNGLIFSLTHLPADLQYGSLRFTIEHLTLVFLLGITLGIIYLRFGLIFAIIFHSLWNSFSLIAQFSITQIELEPFLNLFLLIGNFLLMITLIVVLYWIFRNKNKYIFKNGQIKSNLKISRLTILNFLVIIAYEVLSAIFTSSEQNMFIFLLLLGTQIIFLIFGFLIFEYDVKKRRISIKNSVES